MQKSLNFIKVFVNFSNFSVNFVKEQFLYIKLYWLLTNIFKKNLLQYFLYTLIVILKKIINCVIFYNFC